MLVPVVEKLSTSPAKKPPMLTVALARLVLSGSLAVAPLMTPTGVLLDDAGLLTLSVKVGLVGVIVRLGALSSAMPNGVAMPLTGTLICRNADGAPPLRLPI